MKLTGKKKGGGLTRNAAGAVVGFEGTFRREVKQTVIHDGAPMPAWTRDEDGNVTHNSAGSTYPDIVEHICTDSDQ